MGKGAHGASIQMSMQRPGAEWMEWRIDPEGYTENTHHRQRDTHHRKRDTHLEEQIESNRKHPVGPESSLQLSEL